MQSFRQQHSLLSLNPLQTLVSCIPAPGNVADSSFCQGFNNPSKSFACIQLWLNNYLYFEKILDKKDKKI